MRVLFAAMTALQLLAGCQGPPTRPGPSAQAQSTSAAPATNHVTALAVRDAQTCGRALAIAVRCNLLRDERDFAALRHSALQGLRNRVPQPGEFQRVESSLDVATLAGLQEFATCTAPPDQWSAIEAAVETRLRACSGQ